MRLRPDSGLTGPQVKASFEGRGDEPAPLFLKFVHASTYAKVAEAVRDQLHDVGIAVEPQQMEFSAAVNA